MKPPRNIRRVDLDAKGDHGWVLTLQRKGAILVKRFSDGVYGGKREALRAAVEYRDAFLARDKPVDHQIWIRTRLRKNNTSGIPGVGRYEVVDNPNTGNVRAFWLASWINEHGASRKRKFSVARYGEEEARLLAIAERDYQLRRVCAINVAARTAEHPNEAGIWKASRVEEGRDGEGQRKIRSGNGDHRRGLEERIRVVEAIIDENGNVTLVEPVELTSTRRALVTILAEGRERPRAESESLPRQSPEEGVQEPSIHDSASHADQTDHCSTVPKAETPLSADTHDPTRRTAKDQLFFIQFRAVPAAGNKRLAQYGGAYASAWVDAEILEEAREKASSNIEAAGWEPVKLMHWKMVRRDDYSPASLGEADLRRIRQCIATAMEYGVGLMLSTWPKRERRRRRR